MKLPMTAIVPIMAPMFPDKAQRQFQEDALQELLDIGSISPIDNELGETSIQIRVIDDPSNEPLLTNIWHNPIGLRQYRAIAFKVDGQQCADNLRNSFNSSNAANFTTEEIIELSERHALTCLNLEINIFLLLANILRPGALSAIEGFAFIGTQQRGTTTPFFAEHFFYAIETSEQLGWPKMYSASLSKGWDWLKRSDALIDGIGVHPLGRALAALSHLTSPNLNSTSSIELVWILLGLEALYSRGNVGLKEQLLAKTEALLGPRTENKKAFGIVYDFRSRLLHGDVDLPLRFTEFNAVEKYEKFHAELSQHEGLALAVLLATLQWMVVNNKTDLKFIYAVS
jgi:hypothetical protein